MAKFDDGGMAFPLGTTFYPDGRECDSAQYGLTLLDYFAARALPGVLQNVAENAALAVKASGMNPMDKEVMREVLEEANKLAAKGCYDIAAAMVAEKRRRERVE